MNFRQAIAIAAAAAAVCWAGAGVVERDARDGAARLEANAMSIDLDRGAAGLARYLAAIRTRASLLMVTAHPDDEDGGMLAYQTRGLGARAALLTLTRGEGGQNAMSVDMYDALGLARTQELLQSDRYYGVEQYWGTVIDYGFSKTREEALEKWGYERVLSDAVRVVRMTRPLVVTSVFIGAPTDGHGNHQVAGQMAQEVYLAAGDPHRFPEQIREGLRPWQPLKVYARTPFFADTKDNKIYDYATDKYVPLRFYDYVNKTWLNEKPSTDLTIPESGWAPAQGLTFLQIGRQGWGFQKTQNGGGTLPQPSVYSAPYHRYGSRVPVAGKESSFYDGIDVSLGGIATLAPGDTGFLKEGLARLGEMAEAAQRKFRPDEPHAIAPELARALADTRRLLKQVETSSLAEPGKSDAAFELEVKAGQIEQALTLALGLSFDAAVAPDKEASGPAAFFGGTPPTFTIAIPGQAFTVGANFLSGVANGVKLESVKVGATDGRDWKIAEAKAQKQEGGDPRWRRTRFTVAAPADAAIVRPYFSRPDQEQPYYDLTDERFRNESTAPYPLWANARVSFDGVEWELRKVVQANRRVEGIGVVEDPLLLEPAISIAVSPGAGAIPLHAKSFAFTCTVESNVKGPAKGVLKLRLPKGWTAEPAEVPFSFGRDGDGDTLTFQVTPGRVEAKQYEIRAVAEYGGKSYAEGYRMVGYPGLRRYPYFRPATYRASGVDVETAPGLRVGYFAGTGDEVPRALVDLGIQPQVLASGDLQTGDLSQFDAIILGVRAYAARPELRAANNRLLTYVRNGGVLVVQYNLQNFEGDYGPYSFSLGSNPQKVVDENSRVKLLEPANPALTWPNRITEEDFKGWEEERGHGFMEKWDPHYQALFETGDPEQDPQRGGLLLAHYGRGIYVYDAFALYRQLPSGVPGAYRLLANLVSLGKNPGWK